MKVREVRIFEEDGATMVAVPLGRQKAQEAIISKEDWDFLTKLGLSGNWRSAPTKPGKFYVTTYASKSTNNQVLVARVLLDAGVGTSVRYLDGDALNLRRNNLRLVSDKRAIRRDRDFFQARAA